MIFGGSGAKAVLLKRLLAWRRFDLDGAVMDAVFTGDDLADGYQEGLRIGDVVTSNYVCRQAGFSAGNRSEMQIVHAGDSRNARVSLLDVGDTEPFGTPSHSTLMLFEQGSGTGKHPQSNAHRDGRIGPASAGVADRQGVDGQLFLIRADNWRRAGAK